MATKKRKKGFVPVPGKFYYFGGMVHECDNNGKLRPRPDCGPNHKGKFKNKHYKPAK